jgi:hypothetical protein
MRRAIISGACAAALLASSALGAQASTTHGRLTCPGATPAATSSPFDGTWERTLPYDAWVAAGLDPIDWWTNGGRHTLTLDHGIWLDHDVVPGNPPDACGSFTVRRGTLTADITAVGGATIDRFTLFTSRPVEAHETLTLNQTSSIDDVAAYLFAGTWTEAE